MKACSSTKGKLRKKERKVGTATIIPPAAELEIVSWVNDLRQEGVPPNRRVIAKWIAQGWEMLTPSAISNGFKKCGYPYVDSRQMATAVEDDNFANDVIAELHNLHIVDESYGDIDSDADFDRPGLESETSTANQ
ncbi:hypothetical protein GN958_ATG05575 [Phytophthora infestans]|nr:hypothetical protein GN958_ATG13926 [Phytophthora infestans]KAF4145221.1 hypothetical protein GN958_ATG05575 [Phytophthora infestans]